MEKLKKSLTTDNLATFEPLKSPSPTKLETPATPEVRKEKRDEKRIHRHRREHSDVTGMKEKNTEGDLLIKLQKEKIEKEKKIVSGIANLEDLVNYDEPENKKKDEVEQNEEKKWNHAKPQLQRTVSEPPKEEKPIQPQKLRSSDNIFGNERKEY